MRRLLILVGFAIALFLGVGPLTQGSVQTDTAISAGVQSSCDEVSPSAETQEEEGGERDDPTPEPTPAPTLGRGTIDIDADITRDGAIDPEDLSEDDPGEARWTPGDGALMLVNCDKDIPHIPTYRNDVEDQKEDRDDSVANPGDRHDLGFFFTHVHQAPTLPVKVRLWVDTPVRVRIFRLDPGGYTPVIFPADDPFSSSELGTNEYFFDLGMLPVKWYIEACEYPPTLSPCPLTPREQ